MLHVCPLKGILGKLQQTCKLGKPFNQVQHCPKVRAGLQSLRTGLLISCVLSYGQTKDGKTTVIVEDAGMGMYAVWPPCS